MITKFHDAWFVCSTDRHYHDGCLPANINILPEQSSVLLDMDSRANIEQCREIKCFACQQPLYLFSDRKEVVIKKWPDSTMWSIEQANQFASSVIGKIGALIEDGKGHQILHTWVMAPDTDNDELGQIIALCQLAEDEEQEEQPISSIPLAREAFTPPGWTVKHIGGRCYSLLAPAHNDYVVAMAFSEADARLIAEAPNLFALLKEYLVDHTALRGGDLCDCNYCQSARRLMVRVLGEEK